MKKAFTLIEILIAATIIMIVVIILVGILISSQFEGIQNEPRVDLRILERNGHTWIYPIDTWTMETDLEALQHDPDCRHQSHF